MGQLRRDGDGVGRLDEAIRRYELAVDAATYGESEWQLALYGLGVALDCDGQVERARETLGKVLERDPSLARLHDESVFFEPPGDVRYYEGLAHEIAGDDARALDAFQAYLAAQSGSRYAARARVHVGLLQKRLAGAPPLHQPLVRVGAPMVDHGRRGPGVVQAYVQSRATDFSICYERFLRDHPGKAQSVQLALEIAKEGFARARVLATSEPSLSLSRCIELSVETWRFPLVLDGEAETLLVPIDSAPLAPPR